MGIFLKMCEMLDGFAIFFISVKSMNYRFQGATYKLSLCDPKPYVSVRGCTKKVEKTKTSSDIAVFLRLS